jgi:hypothetical protein
VPVQDVCLWFDLAGSSDNKSKVAYARYKRKLYHDLLYEILGPVRAAQDAGGFRFECDGQITVGYPAMCLFVSDTPERHALALTFPTARCVEGCTMCRRRSADFPDTAGSLTTPLRTAAETENSRLACLNAPNTQVRLSELSRE